MRGYFTLRIRPRAMTILSHLGYPAEIRHFIDLEKDIQGPHTPYVNILPNALLSKDVTRLLHPVETYMNALLHGDLTPTSCSQKLPAFARRSDAVSQESLKGSLAPSSVVFQRASRRRTYQL